MIGTTFFQSVSARIAALQAALANATAAANGAGMVGFAYALAYGAGTIGAWLQGLATGAGATFIGWVQNGAGTVVRKIQDKLRERVSLADFAGYDPTGATAQDAVVAAAIAALPNGGTIYTGPGIFRLTVPVNLANRGAKAITFQGEGSGVYGLYNTAPTSGTSFYGLTGTQAMFECQGSHRICFRDLGMYSLLADANRSVVGVLLGRTTSIPSCEFHHYENVDISLANNAAANAGRGSIGIYNLQGEHGTFDNCRIISDTPLAQFDNNPYPYTATYGVLQVTASSTLNQYKECAFSSLSKYCMELRGCQSTTFLDCYYGTFTGGANLAVAVNITTGNNPPANIFFIGGQCETWNSFMEIGQNCHDIRTDLTWANATGTGPLVKLDVNNGQAAYGCTFKFWNPQNVALQIVSVGAAAGVAMYGGSLSIDQNVSLNAPTLQLLGVEIDDMNAVPATVSVAAGSVYAVRNTSNPAAFYGAQTLAMGGIKVGTAAALVYTSVAMNNGAGAGAGTISNAPANGNPTKWIPINDNGTIRYVPAW